MSSSLEITQAEGRWERWPAQLLENKTVGIVGVGLIAEQLAPKLKAFGMDVIGVSRSGRAVPGIDRMVRRDDLANVAGEIDFLIALVPYEDDTHCLIGAEVLRAMKPTAFLINIARGGVVDEGALVNAEEGRLLDDAESAAQEAWGRFIARHGDVVRVAFADPDDDD